MPNARIDPQWAWQRYQPSAEAPWDRKRAGHLYRRAAFGGSLEELEAAVQAGPERAVSALLAGRADPEGDTLWVTMSQTTARDNNGAQLPALWLYRMLYSA